MPRTGRRSPPPARRDSQHGGPIRQRSQAVRSYKLRSAGQGNRPGHVACRDGESSSSFVGLPACGERSPQLQLWEVHASSFNTSKVMDLSRMFYGCSGLVSLDVSRFDTSKVIDMSFMFRGCESLSSLDVSNFDTSKTMYMFDMFHGCSELTSLDVSRWNTSNVTSMNSMFYGCSSLTSLDLSSFDTSNVTNMYRMFDGCSSLKSISVSETAETRKMLKKSGIEPKGNTTQHKSRHQHER